jgi:hypothetical protein
MLSFKAVAFLLGQTVAGIQIQHDSKGKVHILGGDIISHCEKKKVYLNMYLILNGHQDRAV